MSRYADRTRAPLVDVVGLVLIEAATIVDPWEGPCVVDAIYEAADGKLGLALAAIGRFSRHVRMPTEDWYEDRCRGRHHAVAKLRAAAYQR